MFIKFMTIDGGSILCRASNVEAELQSAGIVPDGHTWDLDVKKPIPSYMFDSYVYTIHEEEIPINRLDQFLSEQLKRSW